MKIRSLFVFVAALFLLASGVFAGGYQRTRDGKTLVWNNDPKPDDEATWSGARDDEGYATGRGTLAWYQKQRKLVTGSNLPAEKAALISRYTGEMKRGKLDGAVVALDSNGKRYHGTFVNGRKSEHWATGPAPKPRLEPNERMSARRAELVEAPAEGPPASATASAPARPTETRTATTAAKPDPAAPKPSPGEFDDSLKSLVGPPTALHNDQGGNTPATAKPQGSPSVSKPQTQPPSLDVSTDVSPEPKASASPKR